jgi:hypothetical protein
MRRVPDKFRLLHGPYEPPPLRKGERTTRLYRDCDVVYHQLERRPYQLAALPGCGPPARRLGALGR